MPRSQMLTICINKSKLFKPRPLANNGKPINRLTFTGSIMENR